jgi:hypothetical protein
MALGELDRVAVDFGHDDDGEWSVVFGESFGRVGSVEKRGGWRTGRGRVEM